MSLSPPTFTPNGDGANDQLRLSFDLLKAEAIPRVVIYDLAGRAIRALPGQAGRLQVFFWDGRTQEGDLAPPGLYLCRVEVQAGIGTRETARVVGIAY